MARETFPDVFAEDQVPEWVEAAVHIQQRFTSQHHRHIMAASRAALHSGQANNKQRQRAGDKQADHHYTVLSSAAHAFVS